MTGMSKKISTSLHLPTDIQDKLCNNPDNSICGVGICISIVVSTASYLNKVQMVHRMNLYWHKDSNFS